MVPLDTLPRTTAPPARGPFGPRRDVSEVMVELHAQHGEELLRFCRSMLRDADDAADALQDTWIRAMKALRDDRARVTAMRPWLYTIARNACLDRLRERKRRSLQDLDEECAGDTPGADEVVAMRHEADAALDRLRLRARLRRGGVRRRGRRVRRVGGGHGRARASVRPRGRAGSRVALRRHKRIAFAGHEPSEMR